MIAGSPTEFARIIKLEMDGKKVTVLRRSITVDIDTAYFSEPEEITWDTTHDTQAHGYYYAPKVGRDGRSRK